MQHAAFFIGPAQFYSKSRGWQDILYYIRPLDYRYAMPVADYFGQFLGNKAGFGQTVEVEMVHSSGARLIDTADCKCRARYAVDAAEPSRQAAHKSSFAAAKITNKLNNLTPLQFRAEPLGELLGLRGAGRTYLQRLAGIHTARIVARIPPPPQVPLGGAD